MTSKRGERDRLRYWPALHTHGRRVVEGVVGRWHALLDAPEVGERPCLAFLAENAGFFFRDQVRGWTLAVAELRLGADFRVDFLVPAEGYSGGPTYTLIEVESPSAALYDAKGYPTRRLTDALQQVQDWRAWVSAYRLEAMELFPSAAWQPFGAAHFRYQIVIGRRARSVPHRRKIQRLAEQNGVEIRSFDYLSDLLEENAHNLFRLQCEGGGALGGLTGNRLANPFVRALGDADWRALIGPVRGSRVFDLLPTLAEDLAARLASSPSLEEFDALWAGLPADVRARVRRVSRHLYGFPAV